MLVDALPVDCLFLGMRQMHLLLDIQLRAHGMEILQLPASQRLQATLAANWFTASSASDMEYENSGAIEARKDEKQAGKIVY